MKNPENAAIYRIYRSDKQDLTNAFYSPGLTFLDRFRRIEILFSSIKLMACKCMNGMLSVARLL